MHSLHSTKFTAIKYNTFLIITCSKDKIEQEISLCLSFKILTLAESKDRHRRSSLKKSRYMHEKVYLFTAIATYMTSNDISLSFVLQLGI